MKNSLLSQAVGNEPYISNSQIRCWSNCSLRYELQYVRQLPPERISIALMFGSAIHAAAELYFRALKNHGSIEPLEALQQHFEDCLTLDLENTFVPVIYKRDLADKAAAIEMGKSMLETFHNSIDLNKMEIVDVEVPLSCTLHTDSGAATDYKLFGILDLILRDASGELIIVDLKTSSKGISQAAAIEDTQLSAYAYLVSANPLAPAKGDVNCQFFVLRKLRQPRLEQISTVRTAFDRKRFARMANAVLAGIDAQIYMPQPSWMCGDCGYSEACKAW